MRLRDLNYTHLLYFHTVAHEGSVLRASRVLNLSPSTVSGQVKLLEEQFEQPLFRRAGRGLVLTSFGELVYEHTQRLFDAGEELLRALSHGEARRPIRVGVSSVLPKLLVREILVRAMRPDVRLTIEEAEAEPLLGALAARRLDVVLTDAEMPPWMSVRGTSHLVVESETAIFGADRFGEILRNHAPTEGLSKVPWLVPPPGTSLRQGLEAWWESTGIEPDIAAVIDDSALLKALADAGLGVFAAPERMTDAILSGYRVQCLGVIPQLLERAYAITREPDPEEPAVRAMCGIGPRE
ncbi:MAG: LysR family transcriptional regulator [Deltaproteobacteria bacterium]|nr:MAG: LysR family transcriptional regulator [Deltaproteobacteria bacterium]